MTQETGEAAAANAALGLDTLADVIRRHYDLGTVERPQPIPQAHQRRHRKLVVSTSAGKFLVKTYKNAPQILDALRFQHRLSDHLHASALPVARIQRAKDGKGIVEGDTWALELQQFIEGAPMRVNSATLAISAKALGRFHEVCRDLPRPQRDTRMWRFSEVPQTSLNQFLERARQEGDEKSAKECADQIAVFLDKAAKELDLEARDRFETGLIHGDWHGGNLLFRDHELIAIVDLEFAGDGCYLEDLAYAMSNLCVRTTNREERLVLRTHILLDEYQKHRSLSYHEHVALYYAVGVKHIATVSYQITQLGGTLAGYSPFEWIKRLSAQCDWLARRADKVRYGERGI